MLISHISNHMNGTNMNHDTGRFTDDVSAFDFASFYG